MSGPIATIPLPDGRALPVLGQGTWHMGESGRTIDNEVAALRLGLDLGVSLIDTAEMYGDGGAERVVADAIAGRRAEVQLVSKVLPSNASFAGTIAACDESLKRLGTDRLDLYLLHWRGGHPLAETVAAFEALKRAGKIAAWGVSNFDVDDMEELAAVPGGEHCTVNQVLYSLEARGPEYDLLPWCRERGIAVMAYSPLGQGRLTRHDELVRLASARGVTPGQLALAFVLAQSGIIAIPKATNPRHVEQNRAAADLVLSPDELSALDRGFPPPRRKQPLAMI